ncbi:MAG: TnpV protein [Lachnospiraceae bacterium]|nr:TnpV protein [Lachnospiraceae bacterium]
MAGITGIQYREVEGIQYPVLDQGMSKERVLSSLGRYGRMAARDLQENDQERYEMMLLSGMLFPKMKEAEEQAKTLHEQISENLVKTWMEQDGIDPYDTMKMTSLRTQADMEAMRQVIEEVIHQVR